MRCGFLTQPENPTANTPCHRWQLDVTLLHSHGFGQASCLSMRERSTTAAHRLFFSEGGSQFSDSAIQTCKSRGLSTWLGTMAVTHQISSVTSRVTINLSRPRALQVAPFPLFSSFPTRGLSRPRVLFDAADMGLFFKVGPFPKKPSSFGVPMCSLKTPQKDEPLETFPHMNHSVASWGFTLLSLSLGWEVFWRYLFIVGVQTIPS